MELARQGVITQAMFDTWSELRNVTAHAAVDPESHDTQTLWSQCGTVATVLNRLVFEAIGYTGAYTDYGTVGWPLTQFASGRTASKESSPEGRP